MGKEVPSRECTGYDYKDVIDTHTGEGPLIIEPNQEVAWALQNLPYDGPRHELKTHIAGPHVFYSCPALEFGTHEGQSYPLCGAGRGYKEAGGEVQYAPCTPISTTQASRVGFTLEGGTIDSVIFNPVEVIAEKRCRMPLIKER